ncbi:MAG TPA: CPBP family intramembrane metalloprotease [Cyanobacteria bacterium UBA11149]|nr:CPBP family intramembrane metalloprotease [Cyanobacteria bacterium UBA11367]HBE56595.1 CPBP family intramembrane metalloprotease [Cyanobacteria bacterium UBA11366]HBK64074.1 CPBP family intramembrane metalloprotease [Cyanobacteria bacterium UBA11166]HBR73830.1 CPBP family intramembrane metalloprotease [Cyanobacteria bacterium UBA11159]HBS70053.1 CPBP family intramembrane metalloprotease [Cyanobacteria bacterium UBA11153]HBW87702.1 CPBP family intramembrane metalloprotease [Cyanobacteria bac
MTKQPPSRPEIEPLTRIQILVAMGITAIVLLCIAKLWLQFGSVELLPVISTPEAVILGLGIGMIVTGVSGLVYRLWPAYRQSADSYLQLVLKPLILPDLIWLGLLPGMSEELLFRGVMLPAVGLNAIGIITSSLVFGILHLSSPQQWPYVVWATVIGLLLGVCAVLTGNLLVPIVAHVVTNLISSCLWKLTHREVEV